jgi:hypothetical protein
MICLISFLLPRSTCHQAPCAYSVWVYLSLAEVQVIGVDPLHFSEVDYSSVQNDFNGFHSSPNYANKRAFAVIKDDSSIMAWGGRD